MKQLNTILSVLSLVGVIILFVLYFKGSNPATPKVVKGNDTSGATIVPGAIAYFEMDSVERNYKYIKDVQEQLKSSQQSISDQLNNSKKNYMSRIEQLQQKASTMSQQEGEAAQAEINQMQMQLQQQEARLTQQLQEKQFKMMQDINKTIEEYLQNYNKDGKFSYILSHSAGDIIYYKDSMNNITSDIVKGLNEAYKKPKPEQK